MKLEQPVKVIAGPMEGAVGLVRGIDEDESIIAVYIAGIVNGIELQGVYEFTPDELKAV